MLLKSFKFFASNFFLKKEYDILFFYPSHFNRGEEKNNKFFEQFYKTCEKNSISYIAIEEPELFKKSVRSPKTIPFDIPLLFILLLRKAMPLKNFSSFEQRERLIAKILRPVFFRKFHFKNYIVLSNSMLGFFRGLEPKARLFDYQHGVIYSNHSGYFTDDNRVAPHIKANDVNLLLQGKKFKEVILKSDKDGYYKNHTYVLGTPFQIKRELNVEKKTYDSNKVIAFSLQFTDDKKHALKHKKWLQTIEKFFEKNRNFFQKNGIKIKMKHHPRFNNSTDMTVLEKFSFVEFTSSSLEQFLENSFLHLTFYSTTIFDASARGIPTILWSHEDSLAKIFEDDFEYTLGVTDTDFIAPAIEKYLNDSYLYIESCKEVRDWYEEVYSPLNEELFLKLFNGAKK